MTDDPVSPELALVDPSLRERLLADAPLADPPPGPVERLRKTTKSDTETLLEQIPARTEPSDGSASYRRRLTVPLVVATCSSLLTLGAVAALLELRGGDGPSAIPASTSSHSPASSPQNTQPAPSTTTQQRSTRTTPPAKAKPPRELRFSWAAVSGATSYDVAFYAHGTHDKLVLELSTRTPTAVVQVREAGSKAAHSLAPGPYRWYVWPVRATGRDSVAVVRSTLTVS
jgi:hypothetical protein